MDCEAMKKLKSTVEKCIDELAAKPTLTPAETEALKNGLEVIDMLECKTDELEMKKYEDSARRSMRTYSGRSYAPIRVSYSEHPMTGYSGDYGVQGWYRSGDGMSNYGQDPRYYGDMYSERRRSYSRHSIGDRAVEKLENMMDTAGSEYEKEELRRFIHMIKSAADY